MPYFLSSGPRARSLVATLAIAASALGLVACGGGDGAAAAGAASGGGEPPAERPNDPPAATRFTVRVDVTGLDGKGLVLQNLAGDDLAVAADGSYSFPTPVADGGNYAVTVRTQPKMLSQTCGLTGGSGTLAGADVTVALNCVTPTARFAYVANLNGHSISGFSVNPDGTLVSIEGAPFLGTEDSAPLAVAATPDGRFLYSVDAANDRVDSHAINADTGVLSEVPGSPTPRDFLAPGAAAVTPSGRFLFVLDSSTFIRTYAINAETGALSATQTLEEPNVGLQALAVDPSGKFLVVTTSISWGDAPVRTVRTYAIDASNGSLTATPYVPLDTGGDGPESIVFHPSGQFVYVGNRFDSTILALRFDASTGALTPASDAGPVRVGPTGTWVGGLAADPRGRFIYGAIEGQTQVAVLSIDPGTGAIAQAAGSPFQVESPMYQLAVDPTGHFLYSLNGADRMTVNRLDTATGAVGSTTGSALTGPLPWSFLLISR